MALALEPKNPTAHYNKGLVYQKQQKLDEAIAELKKVREIDWKFVDPTFNLGELFITKGDAENAIINLKYFLGVNTSSANGHVLLGKAYELKGAKDDAINEYRTALKFDPSYQDAKDALNKLGVKN
jgi:protein O-mannosyl-transferase